MAVAKTTSLSAMMGGRKAPCYSSLPPNATVARAVSDMVRKRRTAVAVIGQGGKLKGIVTRTDLLKAMDSAPDRAVGSQPLSGIMTQALLVAGPEQSYRQALAHMAESNVEHLPVVDGRRLLTVLHQSDLLGYQMRMMASDINYLHAYIEGLHNAEQD